MTYEIIGTYSVAIIKRVDDETMQRIVDGQISDKDVDRMMLNEGRRVDFEREGVDYMRVDNEPNKT